MKNLKKIALTFVVGTTCNLFQSKAVYTSFKGLEKSIPLETIDQLNSLYDSSYPEIENCFKNKVIPNIVFEYSQHINFLKTHHTGPFIHIAPRWVLVSKSIVAQRNLQIGETYLTDPCNPNPLKFKIQGIHDFTYDIKLNPSELWQLTLLEISEGDHLGLLQEPEDLMNEAPKKLFAGDLERIKIVVAAYTKVDSLINILGMIKNGTLITSSTFLKDTIKEVQTIIKALESSPEIKRLITLLTTITKILNQSRPVIGWVYDDLIKLRPEIRARTIRYELAQSLNDHQVFLASPASHTKSNQLIFNHQYAPALCRLNVGSPLGKDIKQFFKGLVKKDKGKTLTFHMLHKSHAMFSKETQDTVPFEFLTIPGEDSGQPIFAFNQEKGIYSVVSVNQIPNGHITTAPVLFNPSILGWIINTIKDKNFEESYAPLIELAGFNLEKPDQPLDGPSDLNIYNKSPEIVRDILSGIENLPSTNSES